MIVIFLLALISFLPPNIGDTSVTVWKSSGCYNNNFKIVLGADKAAQSHFEGNRALKNGKVLYFKAPISDIHKNGSLLTFSIGQYVYSYEKSFRNKIEITNDLMHIDHELPINFHGAFLAKDVIMTCIVPKVSLSACHDCKFKLVSPLAR